MIQRLTPPSVSARNYSDALKLWENSREHPKTQHQPSNVRVLEKRKGWMLKIRKDDNGDVAFRYHFTDVVKWHPDGSVTIQPYSSLSTREFANQFLPYEIDAIFSNRYECDELDTSVVVHGDVYSLRGPNRFAIVDGKWKHVEGDLQSFDKYTLDKKRAAAVRKQYQVSRFKTWATAYIKTVNPPITPVIYRSIEDWTALLVNRDGWKTLATSFDLHNSDPLDLILKHIYKKHDAIIHEEVETIREEDIPAMRRAWRKWG